MADKKRIQDDDTNDETGQTIHDVNEQVAEDLRRQAEQAEAEARDDD